MVPVCDSPTGHFHADIALYKTPPDLAGGVRTDTNIRALNSQDGNLLQGSQRAVDQDEETFESGSSMEDFTWIEFPSRSSSFGKLRGCFFFINSHNAAEFFRSR